MLSNTLTKPRLQVPSTAKVKAPIFEDGRNYVLEPLMQEEKVDIWFFLGTNHLLYCMYCSRFHGSST